MNPDPLRAHVLGFYEPGETLVIYESAPSSHAFGQSVVAHEIIHEELSLKTSHGQFLVILNHFLKHRGADLSQNTIRSFEQDVQLMLNCSVATQEGAATWSQTTQILLDQGETAVAEAIQLLPPEYVTYRSTFAELADNLTSLRCPANVLDVVLRSFAHAALATRIFSVFPADAVPPRPADLRSTLRTLQYNPDLRLALIRRHLRKHGATNLVSLLQPIVAEALGQQRVADTEDFTARILAAVRRWVRDEVALEIDELADDTRKATDRYLDRATKAYQKLGIPSQPQFEPRRGSSHRFRLDRTRRTADAFLENTEELRSWLDTGHGASRATQTPFVSAWALPSPDTDSWSCAFSRIDISEAGGIQSATHLSAAATMGLTMAAVIDLFRQYCHGIVLPSFCTVKLPSAFYAQCADASLPVFVYIDVAAAHMLDRVARYVGQPASLRFYQAASFRPLYAVFREAGGDRNRHLSMLVDPFHRYYFVNELEPTDVDIRLDCLPIESASLSVQLSMWECVFGSFRELPYHDPES